MLLTENITGVDTVHPPSPFLPLSLSSPSHVQLTVYPGVVCVAFNGGWNYPGVEYIWRRIFMEITTTDSDKNHSRMPTLFIMCVHVYTSYV